MDKTLEQILSKVNLNNMEDISQEALRTNTHVFSLANTHADDRVAFAIAKTLRENRFIRSLNIESNFLSGQGVLALLAALQHNQRHICGGKVEMVKLLRENTTLLKLVYRFDLPGPRMTATSILTCNQDRQRQRRLQQSPPGAPGSPAENRAPKKPSRSPKRHPPPPPLDPPTRKVAERVKRQEGANSARSQFNQRKLKVRNGADVLNELRNALKPSPQQRRAEPSSRPLPGASSRNDLKVAIRGSSVQSLKRVSLICPPPPPAVIS